MKTFAVVLLVCYFGAVTASVVPNTSTIHDLIKKAAECRHQAYLQTVNCTKNESNVTSELQCMAKVVADYIDCIGSPSPALLLGAAPLANPVIEKIKCLFNNIVDTAKCVVNGHLNGGFFGIKWSVVLKCLVINGSAVMSCFK